MRRRAGTVALCLVGLLVLSGCEELKARSHIQDGNKAYYAGKYEAAVEHYSIALESQPQLDVGWFNLGLAHLALFAPGLKTDENEAHAEGAIRAFQKYMELHPDDTQARDYLLSTYIDSGRFEGALAYFEKRLEADPKDVEALAQMASINAQAGRFDEAVRWHLKRAEIEESVDARADALYTIGVLAWRRLFQHAEVKGLERAKIADEGIAALQRALEMRPDHAGTLSYINLVYRERALASSSAIFQAVDMATADHYRKVAVELSKKAQPAQPATPQRPAPEQK